MFIGISETHMVKLDISFYITQLLCVRLILNLNRRLHDFHKTFNPGHPPLELFREFYNPPDRSKQRGDI